MKINGIEFDNIKFEVEYKITSIYPEDEIEHSFWSMIPGYNNIVIKRKTHRTDIVEPVFKLIVPENSGLNVLLSNIIDMITFSDPYCHFSKQQLVFNLDIKPNESSGKNLNNLSLNNCLLTYWETEKDEMIYKFQADYFVGNWEFINYLGKFKVPINYSGDLINDIKRSKFNKYGF